MQSSYSYIHHNINR